MVYGNCVRLLAGFTSAHVLRLVVAPEEQAMQILAGLRHVKANVFCCHLILCFHVFCACSQLADAATRFFIETSSFERLPPYSLLSEVHPMAYCDASQDCLFGFFGQLARR